MSFSFQNMNALCVNWERTSFSKAFELIRQTRKLKSSEIEEIGSFPVIDQGQGLIAGFTNDADGLIKGGEGLIIFGDHTRELKFVDFDFVPGADGIKILKPVKALDLKFAFYFLQSQDLPNEGYSRHFKYLKALEVPLPPLEEQKRIAGILDEADRVRKKTQALIDKYDELAQSLFLDMFGDPVTNPKGWEVKPLGELFQISTGKTPSTKDSENFNGNIPFVTPPDFNSDDETDRFLSEKGAAQSRIVPKGSLLVTCIGSIGKTKIVDLPSCFNQQINAIEIGSGWHPEVLELAVQGMRSVLEAAASATTVPILNKGNFQKIKVFVPPAELQESFTSRYRQIQRSVGELKSGKEQGQALFNALLQKAFKGELN